ncbi:Asp-tRNA(Asn)/Glu-tRNA(Gln) amidotransferase subunit GatC [Marinibaculum pumilum]|uniref:Aspartyl/glutamyl-tRNA(Asn/Gln) amidotransferase subunit C n=1 Tax=Marinibaculum pumilum TaxID=1766165 RepID=A0ABV7L3P0_9PROT
MSLDEATVRKIARLARIRVDDAALPGLQKDLNDILSWVEQLNEVDTDGVPPLTSAVETSLRQRPDIVTDGGIPDKVLANAPDATDGFYTVPKVVE